MEDRSVVSTAAKGFGHTQLSVQRCPVDFAVLVAGEELQESLIPVIQVQNCYRLQFGCLIPHKAARVFAALASQAITGICRVDRPSAINARPRIAL